MGEELPPVIALLRGMTQKERKELISRMMEASGLYTTSPSGDISCRYSYDYPAVRELERLVIPVVLAGTLPLDSDEFRVAMRDAGYDADDVIEALLYYTGEVGLTT